MLLDRAGAVRAEQARKVVDALGERFADVRICNTLSGVRRIDGLLRGMPATRGLLSDQSFGMRATAPL
jgi:hypothetical protein